jgi:hypothetical protein
MLLPPRSHTRRGVSYHKTAFLPHLCGHLKYSISKILLFYKPRTDAVDTWATLAHRVTVKGEEERTYSTAFPIILTRDMKTRFQHFLGIRQADRKLFSKQGSADQILECVYVRLHQGR